MSMSRNGYMAILFTLIAAAGCGDDDNAGKVDATPVGTGPGATLKCESSGKNAYDTYGANAFVGVNKKIFQNVTAEVTAHGSDNLGDSFTKVGTGNPASTTDDATKFEGKLAAFLVYAYGGPDDITYSDGVSYHGPQDMVEAHTGLAITDAQYDYFIANIVVPALTASGVAHGTGGSASPDDVTTCFAPIVTNATFKASIVGK
jgi:hypothetical protein